MDGEKPVGGKWNYDQENRKPAPDSVLHTGPKCFSIRNIQVVINLVSERFSENFGNIANFNFATTQSQAEEALDHFIDKALPDFGAYQDAMMMDQPFLFHAIISPYLNIGLLKPLDVCKKAEKAFLDGRAPLNSVEALSGKLLAGENTFAEFISSKAQITLKTTIWIITDHCHLSIGARKVALTVWINALNKQKSSRMHTIFKD